jgi:isopenicillin N synthase-like dioxygenase
MDADVVARSLAGMGVGSLAVTQDTADLVARSFAVARIALDHLEHGAMLSPGCDSANASGSHRVGALSQYNACREGIVFSNGQLVNVAGVERFEEAMALFSDAAFAAAASIFAAIERQLMLPAGWFESTLGPLQQHSQWHVKRYVPEAALAVAVTDDGKHVLLPVHSDPSLISLVLHDAPAVQPGAMGLEYLVSGRASASADAVAEGSADGTAGAPAVGLSSSVCVPTPCAPRPQPERTDESLGPRWQEVGWHGHGVVTVLSGSVLDRITGGAYRAVKHRVAVSDPQRLSGGKRVVATFFVRPAPQAMLVAPPSELLPPSSRQAKPMRFEAWRKKVADKYERHAAKERAASETPPSHAHSCHGRPPSEWPASAAVKEQRPPSSGIGQSRWLLDTLVEDVARGTVGPVARAMAVADNAKDEVEDRGWR